MKLSDLVDGYGSGYSGQTLLKDVGAGIRLCRKAGDLTQTELGMRLGVKKSQVCKMEKGENLTLGTVSEAFEAMGMKAAFSLEPDLDETALYFLTSDLLEYVDAFAKSSGCDFRSAYGILDSRGLIDSFIAGWYEKI